MDARYDQFQAEMIERRQRLLEHYRPRRQRRRLSLRRLAVERVGRRDPGSRLDQGAPLSADGLERRA